MRGMRGPRGPRGPRRFRPLPRGGWLYRPRGWMRRPFWGPGLRGMGCLLPILALALLLSLAILARCV